jgi:phosphoribosylaminoimidazole (AIR) synthetase
MTGEDLYKQDGVDIDLGDAFSAFCAKLGKTTYNSSPFVRMFDLSRDNFRGPRGFQLTALPDGYYQTGTVDGIGTKVVIIDAAGRHITSANNLVAMVAMDITRYGGLPLIMFNLLDARSLGKILDDETYRACQEIVRGLQQVCLAERYVMFTGETAELGLGVGSENPDATVMFNWGAMMLGVYHPYKMILGDTLRPGQVVVVLRDDFRSNGISSVRKALAMKYGLEWWNNKDAMPDIIAAASPSAL